MVIRLPVGKRVLAPTFMAEEKGEASETHLPVHRQEARMPES